MKEIIAVIRPKKVAPTKKALEKLGFPSVTAIYAIGRGKQRGIAGELDIDMRPGLIRAGEEEGKKYLEYIPKRLLFIMVPDEEVEKIVEKLIEVNQTSQIGDGKIFVCPVENAIQIRTNEEGNDAL